MSPILVYLIARSGGDESAYHTDDEDGNEGVDQNPFLDTTHVAGAEHTEQVASGSGDGDQNPPASPSDPTQSHVYFVSTARCLD